MMKRFYGLVLVGMIAGGIYTNQAAAKDRLSELPSSSDSWSNSSDNQDQLTWFYEGIDDYLHERTHDYQDEKARQWYERGRQLVQEWLKEHPQVKEPTLNDIQPAQTQSTQVESAPQIVELTPSTPVEPELPVEPVVEESSSSLSSESVNDEEEDYADIKTPLTKTQHAFIKKLAKDAVPIAKRYDLYPSIMMAQAILESNWGQSKLARQNHNLFGVKEDFQGNSVMMPTNEHLDEADQIINGQFKHYPNFEAALIDYAMVLDQPIYQAVHCSTSKDYRSATKALTGVYATNPHYHQKLNQLIRSYHLDDYDQRQTSQDSHYQPTLTSAKESERSNPTAATDPVNWQWPMLGGVGSVGLIGLIRRFWF